MGRPDDIRVEPLGDSALLITLGDRIDRELTARVRALADAVNERRAAAVAWWPRIVDVVAAVGTLALYFPEGDAPEPLDVTADIRALLAAKPRSLATGRRIEIPVAYGGVDGPDLAEVAQHAGLTQAQVIQLHSSADYLVHAVGFAPGFAYLGGLPTQLAAPRRATPRPRVAPGSLGIGGTQTGVYPLESPGGWNLIGRTSTRLFDPDRSSPSLLHVGDHVRFIPIDPASPSHPAPADPPPAHPPASPAPSRHDHGRRHLIEVARPGVAMAVQDLGRSNRRGDGVPVGGACDSLAARIANWLVGNDEHAAGIEFALVGPELVFHAPAVVALCGADFDGLPSWRPVLLEAGQRVKLGPARRGCRGFLAVAGGVNVPLVMDSRSTLARAGLGGLHGRLLKTGDLLHTGPPRQQRRPGRLAWSVDPRMVAGYLADAPLRILAGSHAHLFHDAWWRGRWQASRQSDRMGLRLEGPPLPRRGTTPPAELLSSAAGPGVIQAPPDGKPIVLLAEAQTIGGYPRVAHVASVDWPSAAQVKPGQDVQFEMIDLHHARQLARERRRLLAVLREGLLEKWR